MLVAIRYPYGTKSSASVLLVTIVKIRRNMFPTSEDWRGRGLVGKRAEGAVIGALTAPAPEYKAKVASWSLDPRVLFRNPKSSFMTHGPRRRCSRHYSDRAH